MRLFYLIVFMVMGALTHVEAQSSGAKELLSLKEYLRSYLSQDELYLQKSLGTGLSKQNLFKAQDYFQSDLSLSLENSDRALDFPEFPTFDFEEQRTFLKGQYSQQSPIGLQASLNGTKFFNNSDSNLGVIDEEFEVELTQSLWKNAFGRQTRFRVQAAEGSLDVSRQAESEELALACTRGVELFTDSYHRQRSMTIHRQLRELSEQAYNLAEKAYDQRLFRKIDFLAAKTDLLDANSRYVEAKRLHEESLSALMTFAKLKEDSLTLDKPNGFFSALSIAKNFEKGKNLAYLREKKNVQLKDAQLRLEKESQRSDVKLGVAIGRREGTNDIGPSITDFEEQTIRAFLQMDWPVINQTRSATIRERFYEKKQAEYKARRTLKEEKQRNQALKLTLAELEERLELSREKVDLYKQQVDQAMNLIRRGKIEFEEFSRYRNSLLQERLGALEIEVKMWKQKMNLSNTNESLMKACKDYL